MIAVIKIKKIESQECEYIIVRNISRIMDIRILDISIENNTVSLVYNNILALEKAKRELWSIGYPILHCKNQEPIKGVRSVLYFEEDTVVH